MHATNSEELSAVSAGRLFGSAVDLFLASGYAAFSVEGAAKRVGVPVGAASRRWPRKAELLVAAVNDAVGELGPIDGGCLRSDLLAVTTRVADDFTRHGELMSAVIGELRNHGDLDRAFRRGFLAPRDHEVRGVFARAAARGELQPGVDPQMVISLIPSVMMYRTLMPSQSLDPLLARHLVDYVLLPVLRTRS